MEPLATLLIFFCWVVPSFLVVYFSEKQKCKTSGVNKQLKKPRDN